MVTLSPKPNQAEAIGALLAAEQQRVVELRQAGVVENLYINRPGRAWLILIAESASHAEQLLSSLPLHPHVEASVESLIG